MSEEAKRARAEAKAAGRKRYSTGVACTHGHVGERYTSSCQCVVCHLASRREYYRANPDAAKANAVAWQKANPARVRQIARAVYARKTGRTPWVDRQPDGWTTLENVR